jgi:CelD/BcsL family acetyltransferase involved in cellulose biosynthesis
VRVQRFDNLRDLRPHRAAWDGLAGGVVFRGWTWLTTWWKHYGAEHPERSLQTLLAFEDDGTLAAILPAYVETTWTQGRAWRLLGDGDVCSDHLGLLCQSASAERSAAALGRAIAADEQWELLEFAAIDEHDAPTNRLLDELAESECMISRTPADRCWKIDLPATWEEFLALQSKSHRKQLRQLERRVLDGPRANWRIVESSRDFGDAWSTLIDLHQRRRQSLGEPGCFAEPTWAAFHWDVAQQLLALGQLRLSTLRLDGRPIAAEYHLASGATTWAYQGGVDPNRLAEEPGQLSTLRSIQRAMAEGHAAFDLLRGDEPYKAHWRATPAQSYCLAAVPNRLWPRLRRGAFSGAKHLRQASRQLTELFT